MRKRVKTIFGWASRQRFRLLALLALCGFAAWQQLPDPLFDDPYSVVIEDRDGRLLGARIAADGQWRFPPGMAVSESFETALLTFEDKRFYNHSGMDPLALGRALWLNLKSGSVVSGGSTLSMQVIRLMRKNPPRSIGEKLKEMVLAYVLEARYSKSEILALWSDHAPFGGNVVGLEAASWRYFSKSPDQLSQAEAACLAVLPNNPALVNPGRNSEQLQAKRDFLLAELKEQGYLTPMEYDLSLLEPLPGRPQPLPQAAHHLLNTLMQKQGGQRFHTTLDASLQTRVNHLALRHSERLEQNGVNNLAAIILEIPSGEVRAYVGNVPGLSDEHGRAVDVIPAPRSSGSILKPLLYGLMLEEGLLTPASLVPDVPAYFSSFAPKNYTHTYDGAVPAKMAIARSLNVPAVLMLRDYGQPRFHYALQQWGFESVRFPANHYGLSLILGGAEISLWNLVKVYGRLATRLLNSEERWSEPLVQIQLEEKTHQGAHQDLLDKGAIYQMLDAMTALKRPEEEAAWDLFASSRKVAWKTGTSFGHRDAWAVGITPRYVVGVWTGNADGEGRPELSGASAAAPLLFQIFGLLPRTDWFSRPDTELPDVEVCTESGYRKGPYCEQTRVIRVTQAGLRSELCPYHQVVHLDPSGQFRVSDACDGFAERQQQSWFVLPPAMKFYYRKRNPTYRTLPQYKPGCAPSEAERQISVIYPQPNARLFLPVDIDGMPQEAVFEAVHRQADTKLYWHLDEQYLGATLGIHQVTVRPLAGTHKLTLVDELGERKEVTFEVVGEE